jgi:hypothetical protein
MRGLIVLFLAGIFIPGSGCSAEEIPVGPPRCEPSSELALERALKEGYKALVLNNAERARARFNDVLSKEKDHPEAHSGMRLVGRNSRQSARAVIEVNGQLLPSALPMQRMRYRFEEEAAQAPLRRKLMGQDKASGSSYVKRRSGSADAEGKLSDKQFRALISLVVIHDADTTSVVRFFIQSLANQRAMHFVIDQQGTIYQTLDLVFAARHSKNIGLNNRSIAVALVRDGDGSQGGKGGGYSAAQHRALRRLLNGLFKLFPGLPAQLPRTKDGTVQLGVLSAPDAFKGVSGHRHVVPGATDPGADFDWYRLGLRD